MVNLTAVFAVALLAVLGVLAVFGITAHGATAGTAQQDSFGQTPPANAVTINNQSSDLLIKSTSSILYLPFMLISCVAIISGVVWLRNAGRLKKDSY